MDAALENVTVADFTQMMQGPWATQKLAEMGADVIKIERIGGEWERTLEAFGELYDGVSPFFLAMNRNKRSVAVDLKTDEGGRIARDIVESADVLVENFRPGVMDRLGLGYEDVSEINPEIIYVSGTGFGSDGPYVDRPGQDLLLQAMTGLTKTTGRRDDPPTPAGSAVVDEHSAMLIAFGTVSALYYRAQTGEGQRVDTSLLNAAIDFQCQEITAALNMDREPERSEAGIASPVNNAPYGIYETADGHVAIAMASLDTLSELLDIASLAEYEDSRAVFEDRDEIKRAIEAKTRTHRTDELLDVLLDTDVWAAEVNDFKEMTVDPQVEHNDMLVEIEHPEVGTFETVAPPVSFSETPAEISSPPPTVGEHTTEILLEHDYDEAEIEQLRDNEIVQT